MSPNEKLKQYVSSRWSSNHDHADFVFVVNSSPVNNTETKAKVTCEVDKLLIDYICCGYIVKNETSEYETMISRSGTFYRLHNDNMSMKTVGFYESQLKHAIIMLYKLNTDLTQHDVPPQGRNLTEENATVKEARGISNFNFSQRDHVTFKIDINVIRL